MFVYVCVCVCVVNHVKTTNETEWIMKNFEVMNTILSPSDRLHVDTIERPCPVSQWTFLYRVNSDRYILFIHYF